MPSGSPSILKPLIPSIVSSITLAEIATGLFKKNANDKNIVIKKRIEDANARYWAGDKISEFIYDELEREDLIDEVTGKFEDVLDSLLIDRHGDPNSQGTGRRLAKMYINEIMSGRYNPRPVATAFPNDSRSVIAGCL